MQKLRCWAVATSHPNWTVYLNSLWEHVISYKGVGSSFHIHAHGYTPLSLIWQLPHFSSNSYGKTHLSRNEKTYCRTVDIPDSHTVNTENISVIPDVFQNYWNMKRISNNVIFSYFCGKPEVQVISHFIFYWLTMHELDKISFSKCFRYLIRQEYVGIFWSGAWRPFAGSGDPY